jgi:hypothetical protein
MAATEAATSKIKDGFGDAGTAVTRAQEGMESFGGVQANLDAGLKKLEERLKTFSDSALGLAAAAEELRSSLKGVASVSSEGDGGLQEGRGGPGFFWFLENEGEDYDKAKKDYITSSLGFAEEWHEKLTGKRIDLAGKEFTALAGYNELHTRSVNARKQVTETAYNAMEKQLLSLVETHRFSARAFGEAVAQQVKIELTGLAARAAVWAIYETAMGFKDLATPGMQGLAALHFKSAAEFAAVSGAALLGAAAVQEFVFGGKGEQSNPGSSGTGGKSLQAMPAASPATLTSQDTTPVQHITINIHNPLSEQNWTEIAENNIAPALEGLKDRNVELLINSA